MRLASNTLWKLARIRTIAPLYKARTSVNTLLCARNFFRTSYIAQSRLQKHQFFPIGTFNKPCLVRGIHTNSSSMSSSPEHFMHTSGGNDSVWVHQLPFSKIPKFSPLTHDVETDVCIVGAGIAGLQIAYELVVRGEKVAMIEARDVLSGESGRTSGHLANALDDHYTQIAKKHGVEGAKVAAESHTWALNHVGEVSKNLGIECEYRHLPGYEISQYSHGDAKHDEDVKALKAEVEMAKSLGLDVVYQDGFAVKGWDGKPDQRDAAIFKNQATFHPTKYLVGLLDWLKQQRNFECYTHTRMVSIEEKGIEIAGLGSKSVKIETENGHKISAKHAVEATCVPLQKLSIVAEMVYDRTYCIAIRVPKGSIEDCLLYDSAEAYKYVRFTACDDKDDYLVIGGCDHKTGQESAAGRFEELETWVRERFTRAGSVDYKWSGQIYEPVDFMGFIGRNQGQKNIFVVTGDSGNGLTHGVLAGKLIADEIQGVSNKWAKLYDPNRVASIGKSALSMLGHDIEINRQYKRFLQSDIQDIEDLGAGTGGVLNPKTSTPVAIYKDEKGQVHKFSALCPHMMGVVCWNNLEESWDCPVHGSRFSKDGVCIQGPAKKNLTPEGKMGQAAQQAAIES